MIDLTIYDFLERCVKTKESELIKFQTECGCNTDMVKLGINSLQSIIRSAVVEEQQEDPSYSRIYFEKNGWVSIKPGNIRFDINSVISLLSNVLGIITQEKWAILMAVLSVLAELKKLKVQLTPEMSRIVLYLYNHNYREQMKRGIEESQLETMMKKELEEPKKNVFPEMFITAIEGLAKLKVIRIEEGKIYLAEAVKI